MDVLVVIYFIIAVIVLISTLNYMSEKDMEGIDNCWDWIIYGIFWIVQPIKATIKLFKN